MRTAALAFLAATFAASTANSEAFFYVEKGNWTIGSGSTKCRALNRPAQEFNFQPFNALQILVGPNMSIGLEVSFWPGAFNPSVPPKLKISFDPGETFTLDAEPVLGDYMLATDGPVTLWRQFQDADSVMVSLEGDPNVRLLFGLANMPELLALLQRCASSLPKP